MELWHDYTFYSFIFLNSEKNEPRSAAAVIGLLGLSPQSPSGSAELASFGQSSPIFPPSSLRLHRPIKAESGDLACILTPSPFGHSPYIPLRKHRGRGGLTLLLPLQVFLIPLLVATLLSSPLYFALQNAGEEGNTSFRNEVGYRSFFFAVL